MYRWEGPRSPSFYSRILSISHDLQLTPVAVHTYSCCTVMQRLGLSIIHTRHYSYPPTNDLRYRATAHSTCAPPARRPPGPRHTDRWRRSPRPLHRRELTSTHLSAAVARAHPPTPPIAARHSRLSASSRPPPPPPPPPRRGASAYAAETPRDGGGCAPGGGTAAVPLVGCPPSARGRVRSGRQARRGRRPTVVQRELELAPMPYGAEGEVERLLGDMAGTATRATVTAAITAARAVRRLRGLPPVRPRRAAHSRGWKSRRGRPPNATRPRSRRRAAARSSSRSPAAAPSVRRRRLLGERREVGRREVDAARHGVEREPGPSSTPWQADGTSSAASSACRTRGARPPSPTRAGGI